VGLLKESFITKSPFRAPHHTSSYSAIIGGGQSLRPGELSLAHHGILFLDEFLEFDRRVIDALRQPLEEHSITIARQKGSVTLPAKTILLIAFNPCPCGYFGSSIKSCICTPTTVLHYQKKLSGPIIDRIDLWSEVTTANREVLFEQHQSKSETEDVQKQVEKARAIQHERYKNHPHIHINNEIRGKELATFCPLELDVKKLLVDWSNRLKLSLRAQTRVIKVARTIADLSEKEKIDGESILEALQYRPKLGWSQEM
jgi:magnesium chelatase family protein